MKTDIISEIWLVRDINTDVEGYNKHIMKSKLKVPSFEFSPLEPIVDSVHRDRWSYKNHLPTVGKHIDFDFSNH